ATARGLPAPGSGRTSLADRRAPCPGHRRRPGLGSRPQGLRRDGRQGSRLRRCRVGPRGPADPAPLRQLTRLARARSRPGHTEMQPAAESSMTWVDWVFWLLDSSGVKWVFLILALVMPLASLLTWAERRQSAMMQDRL